MNLARNKEASLAEELPYWDFFDEPKPHLVLADGSLVGGLRVSLMDIECFDDSDVNQFTSGLRAALNSVAEGTSLQFVLSVRSDFSRMIDDHTSNQSEMAHCLIKSIAEQRKDKLLSALKNREIYKPELRVYLRTPVSLAKKSAFFKRKELFTKIATDAYRDTLEVLSQNLESFANSLKAVGLECTSIQKHEVINHVYEFLNPKRSI